ncbi:MAG TPA: hypothetical protein VIU86_15125, partial [Gaiellaceae bacterium]
MSHHRPARRKAAAAVTAVAALALAAGATTALGDGDPQPIDFSHNAINAPAPVIGAVFGQSPAVKTGTAICTTGPQAGP